MFWETKNQKIMEDMHERIIELDLKYQKLLETKPDYLSAEEKSRLADLEVKMAKLWSMLVETTPAGKEKLSKFGRRFGGQSKGFLER